MTGGLPEDEVAAALGGYCAESLGVVLTKNDDNDRCWKKLGGGNTYWESCTVAGPRTQTSSTGALNCCDYSFTDGITDFTKECDNQDIANFTSHQCMDGEIRPTSDFINPYTGTSVTDWTFDGDAVVDNDSVILNNNSSIIQSHGSSTSSNNKRYRLTFDITEVNNIVSGEIELKLMHSDNSYITSPIVMLGNEATGDITTNNYQFDFTSDNDIENPNEDDPPPTGRTTPDGNDDGAPGITEGDFVRELIIKLGGNNDGQEGYIGIDNITLKEITFFGDVDINGITYNDGAYTWGAQLLVGDFSGDNLIGYTTQDLDPSDCVDFQSGNPENKRYWKNIIPQNYDVTYREELGTEQEWIDENLNLPGNNNYYYPVLPKYDKYGVFASAGGKFYPGGDYDYPNDKIPFPTDSFITKENFEEESMLINIYNNKIDTNVYSDGSGNDNNGFITNDYKPKYNNQTSKPNVIKNVDRIRTSKDKGAF